MRAVLIAHPPADRRRSASIPIRRPARAAPWSASPPRPIVPLDLLCATGTSYFGAPPLPYVPGVQGVGVVEQSDSVPAGTRVWFATKAGMAPGDGSLAELCAVPDADLVPDQRPSPSDAAVAALGTSALAAWMSLTWRARLQPGETVLVLGAGGAVGQAAIAAARLLGAGRVVAVCRPAASEERARRGRGRRRRARHRRRRRPRGGDLGRHRRARSTSSSTRSSASRPPRRPVCSVRAAGWSTWAGPRRTGATFSSAMLRSRSLEVLGYTNNAITPEQRLEAFTSLIRYAAEGRIRVAFETCPLQRADEAWSRQASGDTDGRLVLQV